MDIDYGDGSDGDVIVTDVLTLIRNMNFKTLTVLNGAKIESNGFIIRCSEGYHDLTGPLFRSTVRP